jgi:hypothetical protein
MVHYQNDYRTDDGNRNAADIDTRDTPVTETLEDCTADDRPDNPEDNIKNQAPAAAVDDLASDEARNETDYEPSYDSHIILPNKIWIRLNREPVIEGQGQPPATDGLGRTSILGAPSAWQGYGLSPLNESLRKTYQQSIVWPNVRHHSH